MSRRLAAILAADVVGYSALMAEDEADTLAALKAHRADLFEPEVARHGGRVVKLMGDGALVEFPSVVDAVVCAIAIQSAMAADRSGRIRLRIGIHLGDVIPEGDDIYGDGVNIAARLEGLAEPGGICVSAVVRESLGNRVEADFVDAGEHALKNIPQSVRVFRWTAEASADTETSTSLNQSRKPSIAVLPFTNMSGDPGQEYFSDGVTEDIITALSYFRSFPVIARNSTFTYKGQAVRVQQVAEELGARYVLEGSIRKAGDRIRITVQLIDAETGHHVWADRFDSTMEDIFDVQDEISRRIVVTIQPELAQAELEKASIKRPENLTAWDLMLRGMDLINRHTSDDHESARKLFRSAIDLDPEYAGAWAGLALSYLIGISLVGTDERQDLLEKGSEAATRAVELDSRSALAHYVLGVAYAWRERYSESINEAEIALQLNPYYAQAHMGLGNRLDLVGRTAEGISKMEQALRLSPRDSFCPLMMAYLSRAHLGQDQPAQALEWIEKAVNLQPKNPDFQYRYAVCLSRLDRVAEAKKALKECERLQPGFLKKREHWRPYADDERNQRFFAGMLRHNLISEE